MVIWLAELPEVAPVVRVPPVINWIGIEKAGAAPRCPTLAFEL